jgi:(E)-4-hydroxy-3-methylbut-2-enyl-diphosphate synthase
MNRRRITREVMIGDVGVGGRQPIRVQSMTTPATTDTAGTVEQIERLVGAGCEIVRLTVPRSADADNLPAIRRELERRGVRVPLVADIHFTPAAAMKAVEHVEKVRINPGNFADKKRFAVREYDDEQYGLELERIAETVTPLIRRSKELGRAMRIGTNHGSLSDRIMNRYGDTPLGMVESALEFVRICESHGYRDLVLSMKASNPLVVLQAYRLLVERMEAEEMHYPLHLGVTEAGDGEDARIKSAIGIGTLLAEGLGDTVRVSLTEDPVREIPVARALIDALALPADEAAATTTAAAPQATERREAEPVTAGPLRWGVRPPLVEVPLSGTLLDPEGLRRELDAQVGARVPEETRADVVGVRVDAGDEEQVDAFETFAESVALVAPATGLSAELAGDWREAPSRALTRLGRAAARLHVRIDAPLDAAAFRKLSEAPPATTPLLLEFCAVEPAVPLVGAFGPRPLLVALDPAADPHPGAALRRLAAALDEAGLRPPLVLLDRPEERPGDPLLTAAAYCGGALCDGLGDAVQIRRASALESRRQGFNILQAARARITRTEFISCPSCGRTLFDLESTTARIKARTSHLKGVKIAVMGCIVNGPGEMADADFGYVGWGEDKIALFVGKRMVAKDVPTGEADERLVALIKEHGRWVEPPVEAG